MVERVRRRRINPPRPAGWHAEPGRFWVYVLENENGGTTYVGQTNDLAGRLRQHNDPANTRSLYTKRTAGPCRLVYSEECESRREAMARERFLKSEQGRE